MQAWLEILTDPNQTEHKSSGNKMTDQLALNLLLNRKMMPVQSCPVGHSTLTDTPPPPSLHRDTKKHLI
jgi:hypothetical protein